MPTPAWIWVSRWSASGGPRESHRVAGFFLVANEVIELSEVLGNRVTRSVTLPSTAEERERFSRAIAAWSPTIHPRQEPEAGPDTPVGVYWQLAVPGTTGLVEWAGAEAQLPPAVREWARAWWQRTERAMGAALPAGGGPWFSAAPLHGESIAALRAAGQIPRVSRAEVTKKPLATVLAEPFRLHAGLPGEWTVEGVGRIEADNPFLLIEHDGAVYQILRYSTSSR